ncbi:phage tail tape measure protein [Meridianimarinicoccus sp. RP-17]|uniref:phage tail tape measure protein n=1 Tax=Meridianimarinicoccus zhengii TaxID=2056810 RepID=UPI000DAEB67B|nr:phage tail tape measure protein [Phycocomes zhengii]
MSDLNIAMILRLVDQVTGPSKRVLASMREVGVAVDGAGRGMLNTADRLGAVQAQQLGIVQNQALGIAGLATAAYGLLRPAAEFEAAMDKVGAVANASDAEVARLTATARELGATTPWAASQAAEGMQFLAMAGFDVNETIAAMPGMLNLASAGATDLATTADIASNILSGFNIDASETGRVGDVLTNAFTNSNTNLAMLGETMKYVAPQAAAVGLSLEEAAAMAGKLGDAGIQGSMAGTALRAMISRLAGPTGAAADALEQLGIETADADGNLRPMIDILAEMDAAMKALGSAEQATLNKAIFGEEASAAAQVLMIQAGSGALREFAGEMREQGSAARVAEQQNDNVAGAMKALNSITTELSLTIGDFMLPALRDLLDGLTPILRSLNEWMQANPEIVGALGQLVIWLAAFAIGSIVARLAFVAFLQPIRWVLRLFGNLFIWATRLNPFAWMAVGVLALIYTIYDSFDGIVKYFSDKFFAIKAAFEKDFVSGLLEVWIQYNPLGLIYDALTGLTAYWGEEVASWIAAIDDAFTGFSLYDSGKQMIRTLWDGASSLLSQMVESIKETIRGIIPESWLEYIGMEAGGGSTAPAVDMTGPMLPPRADENFVQTNTFNIQQQPGESTDELARRTADYLRQNGGAGSSVQRLSDTPEDME